MASRTRRRKIVDTREEGRLVHTPGEEYQLRKDMPELRRRGEKPRTISPRKEENKYIVPWDELE
jgi:hypothetical protein